MAGQIESVPVLAVPGGGLREAHGDVVALGGRRAQDGHRPRLVALARQATEAAHEGRHPVQGPDRGRQGEALELTRQAHEALHGGDQVDAPLAADHGVDLVEDHALQPGEQAAPAPGGEQQVEGLRGGDQDLRRLPQHAPAVLRRRVPRAGEGADGGEGLAGGPEALAQLLQRPQEVALDVVVERLQGGDVEDAGGALRPVAADQPVEGPQEGGQGLAGAGGRGDQQVLAGGDARPGGGLHVGGGADALGEPPAHEGMEQLEGGLRPRRRGGAHGLVRRAASTTARNSSMPVPTPRTQRLIHSLMATVTMCSRSGLPFSQGATGHTAWPCLSHS